MQGSTCEDWHIFCYFHHVAKTYFSVVLFLTYLLKRNLKFVFQSLLFFNLCTLFLWMLYRSDSNPILMGLSDLSSYGIILLWQLPYTSRMSVLNFCTQHQRTWSLVSSSQDKRENKNKKLPHTYAHENV